MGIAVPHRIGRHVHPDARPDLPPPAAPTGIDYLGLVAEQYRAELAVRINYTDLPGPHPVAGDTPVQLLEAELASFTTFGEQLAAGELPGQLDLTDPTNDDSDSEGQR